MTWIICAEVERTVNWACRPAVVYYLVIERSCLEDLSVFNSQHLEENKLTRREMLPLKGSFVWGAIRITAVQRGNRRSHAGERNSMASHSSQNRRPQSLYRWPRRQVTALICCSTTSFPKLRWLFPSSTTKTLSCNEAQMITLHLKNDVIWAQLLFKLSGMTGLSPSAYMDEARTALRRGRDGGRGRGNEGGMRRSIVE